MRVLLALFLLIGVNSYSQIVVTSLLCDTKHNPIGVGETNPRFSWKLNSIKRNVYQSAFKSGGLKIRLQKNTIGKQLKFIPINL